MTAFESLVMSGALLVLIGVCGIVTTLGAALRDWLDREEQSPPRA